MSEREIDEGTLQAFHDGELGPLARWRFERRLAASAELRRELQMLEAVGDLVRASEVAAPTPDLWDGIAGRLRAIDAERAEAAQPRRSGLELLWKPASALAAVAIVAVLAFGRFSGETVSGGVVHWVDSGDRNVMVLDGDRDVTVIWVFDAPPVGAVRGGGRASA